MITKHAHFLSLRPDLNDPFLYRCVSLRTSSLNCHSHESSRTLPLCGDIYLFLLGGGNVSPPEYHLVSFGRLVQEDRPGLVLRGLRKLMEDVTNQSRPGSPSLTIRLSLDAVALDSAWVLFSNWRILGARSVAGKNIPPSSC